MADIKIKSAYSVPARPIVIMYSVMGQMKWSSLIPVTEEILYIRM